MSGIVKITHKGDFSKTTKFFNFISKGRYLESKLDSYGRMGVEALRNNTPVDSGKTASSWGYEIDTHPGGISIIWTNDNMAGSVPVAILIEYGHATRFGAYIEGKDFINPAIQPVFEKISEEIWKEVTNA